MTIITSPETAAQLSANAERRQVAALNDGDFFSLDDGHSWNTCCIVLWGNITVYVDERRDDDALTRRIDAERNSIALVASQCLFCASPTTETVRGRISDREGVMCADCQHHCDGNTITEEG